jgi:hypothetical protein
MGGPVLQEVEICLGGRTVCVDKEIVDLNTPITQGFDGLERAIGTRIRFVPWQSF